MKAVCKVYLLADNKIIAFYAYVASILLLRTCAMKIVHILG